MDHLDTTQQEILHYFKTNFPPPPPPFGSGVMLKLDEDYNAYHLGFTSIAFLMLFLSCNFLFYALKTSFYVITLCFAFQACFSVIKVFDSFVLFLSFVISLCFSPLCFLFVDEKRGEWYLVSLL